MDVSIRDTCRDCLDRTGTLSVVRDFFGYQAGPVDPGLSLLTQIRRLRSPHVHMNIILVGTETYMAADIQEVDAAIQFTRDTYAQVNLGVGRVLWFNIPIAESHGHEDIGNDDEAETLVDEYTVNNDALDIFIVQTYAGNTVGVSGVRGPCDKDLKGIDGSVISIETIHTGIVLAHEAAHYLGLEHAVPINNLMFSTLSDEDGNLIGGQLTPNQEHIMRQHCFMRAPCSAVV